MHVTARNLLRHASEYCLWEALYALEKVTVTGVLSFCRQSLKSRRKIIQSHTCQAPPAALVLPYQCLATARVMTTPPAQCPVITRPTSTRQRRSGMTHSISSNRELASPKQIAWTLRTSHHHHHHHHHQDHRLSCWSLQVKDENCFFHVFIGRLWHLVPSVYIRISTAVLDIGFRYYFQMF